MAKLMPRFPLRTGLLLSAVATLLAGCAEDYLDRRDTIASSSGNAVETNIATHVIDPWPRRAFDTSIPADGSRVQGAVERYRTGEIIEPRVGASAAKAAPGASAAATR